MALTVQIMHGCVAQKLIGLHSDATYTFPENEVRLLVFVLVFSMHISRETEDDSSTF